jgi:tetratricopeptide (TPR) repeat protein
MPITETGRGRVLLVSMQREHSQLMADVMGTDDQRVIEAATQLLTDAPGGPEASHLLMGGKAALRLRRISDAAILLYHALRVVEPGTALWAEILVNRCVACAHHGYYLDAVDAGNEFLGNMEVISPQQRAKWLPKVHHALALCHHRMGDYRLAAKHFRMAADGYTVPVETAVALCDLAWALALAGDADAGEIALHDVNQAALTEAAWSVFHGTTAVVLYHQGRYCEAQAAGDRAEASVQGQDASSSPLLELRFWRSRIAWELGDRAVAGTLALHVAMRAESAFNVAMRNRANDWLVDMMKQGGIRGA